MSERRRLLMAQGEEDNPWEKIDYLTFVPLNGTLILDVYNAYIVTYEYDEETGEEIVNIRNCPFEYTLNDGISWKKVKGDADGNATRISVAEGKTLKIRANIGWYLDGEGESHSMLFLGKTGKYAVAGTPMSLLDSDINEMLNVELHNSYLQYCFRGLFENDSRLVQILNPKTFLPATRVGIGSYANMFYNCSSLVNAPYLPASLVEEHAYASMFEYCSSLIEVPTLSFSVVAWQGACRMFSNCTALKKVSLNLSSSGNYGFQHMFYRCYSLIEASGQITISSQYSCYGMFLDCSSLVIAPELPSKNAPSGCYNEMFYNCSSLNYIKAMFTVRPAATFLYDWVYGVASTGTFVKNKDATWTNTFGRSAIPTGWTVITE